MLNDSLSGAIFMGSPSIKETTKKRRSGKKSGIGKQPEGLHSPANSTPPTPESLAAASVAVQEGPTSQTSLVIPQIEINNTEFKILENQRGLIF